MRNLKLALLRTAMAILCISPTLCLTAQSPHAPGTEPVCGSDLRMHMSISATPDGQMKWDENEEYLTDYVRYLQTKAMPPDPVLGEDYFVIPVVFHIIHAEGDAVGTGSNISYEQIISQMNVLNEEFGGGDQGEPTDISFCLARNPSPSSADWFDGDEPGVRRYPDNGATAHAMSYAGEIALLELTHPDYGSSDPDYFPYSKYLNIWVVSSIADTNDGTVMGYGVMQPGNFNASTESGIDGIVMRHDAIGSSEDGNYSLFSGVNLGKVLIHEVGHYLNLYHPFHLVCSGIPEDGSTYDCLTQGDRVCDTPPQNEYVQSLCSSGSHINSQGTQIGNTCTDHLDWDSIFDLYPNTQNYIQFDTNDDAYDLIEAHMGYSLDACRKTFTFGQKKRMHARLSSFRSGLSATANLVFTGVAGGNACIPPILVADIMMNNGSSFQLCLGGVANFSTIIGDGYSATSWTWDFGDGSPTAAGNSVAHTYLNTGAYTVTLTASDGTEEEIHSIHIFISNCSIQEPNKANWVYGAHVALDFSSGLPEFSTLALDPPANPGRTMYTKEGCVSVSDSETGDLLFYSDGRSVWDADGHQLNAIAPLIWSDLSPTPDLCGGLAQFQSVHKMSYAPRPNHPGEYYILIPSQSGVDVSLDIPVGIHIIYVNLNDGPYGSAIYEGILNVHGPPTYTQDHEVIEVVPHCNGVDYWVLYEQQGYGGGMHVYLLSELGFSNADMSISTWDEGFVTPDVYVFGDYYTGGWPSVFSDDGTIFATVVFISGLGHRTQIYQFDNATGSLTLLNTLNILLDAFGSFSPNNDYIYYTPQGTLGTIKRLSIATGLVEDVSPIGHFDDLRIGPDGERLYVVNNYFGDSSGNLSKAISVFNTPNEIDPSFQPNILGWNNQCAKNGQRFPDFPNGQPNEPQPLTFEVTNIDCSTVELATSGCYLNYELDWDFGDGQNGNGNNVQHSYSSYDTYTVMLTASRSGWLPVTVTMQVTVGQPQIGNIYAAPVTVCESSNQELAIAEVLGLASYQWSMDGGGQFTNGLMTDDGLSVTAFWTTVGVHTVSLSGIPSNPHCLSSSTNIEIEVLDKPSVLLSEQGCSISAAISGGESPYQDIKWYNNSGSIVQAGGAIYGPINIGTYQFSVEDNNGCMVYAEIEIIDECEPCSFTSSITSVENVSCFGANNGSAIVTTTGGTGTYTYLWSNSNTTAAATGLGVGVHTVIVTDASGCPAVSLVNITQPSVLLATIGSSTNVTCNALNDGTATVVATGGSIPYTYLWSNGNTTATATSLASGSHSVTINDANGCASTASVTIAAPISYFMGNAVGASCLVENDILVGGNIMGGTPPYNVIDYNGLSAFIFGDNQYMISGAGATPQTITLEDATGCQFEITTYDLTPIVTAEVAITGNLTVCNGGTTELTAVPVSYNLWVNEFVWNGSSGQDPATITVGAGQHTVLLRDNLGCTDEATVTVQTIPIDNTITHTTECLYVPGATIQFSNSTPGAGFLWCFDLYSYSTSQNPTHAFSQPGIYPIWVAIYTPGCPAQYVQTIVTIDDFDNTGIININSTTQASNWASAWNGNTQTFGQDIVFGNGSNTMSATINDATFILGPNVDIIINEGATVTFNRCTFTSCSTWQGFNVKSNINTSTNPTSAPPGILRMDNLNIQNSSNYSTIEYALIGIRTSDLRQGASSQSISSLQGGTIDCGRTRFINCQQAFDVQNATSKASRFRLCQFRVNNAIAQRFPHNLANNGYSQMTQQCRHLRSIGYNYYGCSWENTMDTHIKRWENRGRAVFLNSATVTITRYSTSQQTHTHGSISGFDFGVLKGLKGGNIILAYQNFEQNHIGAHIARSYSDRVFKNTFTIGSPTNVEHLDNDPTYGTVPNIGGSINIDADPTTSYEGLVVQNSDLTEIAENTFTGVPESDGGIHQDYPRIGIRVRSTLTQNMVVRKNTLSKLNYGNLANGNNAGGTSNSSGLRYICNVNSNNLQDFTNTDFVEQQGSARIAKNQFEPEGSFLGQDFDWPSGNVLSVDLDLGQGPVSESFIHFRNEGPTNVTYWHSNSTNQTPTDAFGLSYENTQNVMHTCPAKYSTTVLIHTPSVISSFVSAGMITRDEALLYEYAYLLLMDGGDTEALEEFVENTWGSEVWDTREELLSISPYVSESVIRRLLDHTEVYSHAIAFDVLLANPDVLNDRKLIDYLSEKVNPMPEYLIDLLLAYGTGTTERTEMEEELGRKRTRHIHNVSEALWGMMDYYEDDTYTEEDFYNVIDSIWSLTSEMAMIEYYLNEGNVYKANERLDELTDRVKFGKEEEDEYFALQDWVQLRSDMITAGREWEDMTPADSTLLVELLDYFDTQAAAQAMAVLNEYKGTDYFMPPAYGESGLVKRAKRSVKEINNQLIDVYPNPADYMATIKLKEALPSREMCQLIITDIQGREVANYPINPEIRQYPVNTKDWAAGIYAFKIVVHNSPIEFSGKINVAH